MSRLDSFIRRALAQRDCLGDAARLIDGLPGPVIELGLGNGRTYGHLRTLLPAREIFVFDRQVMAHPDCVPDARHFFWAISKLPFRALYHVSARRLLYCTAISAAAMSRKRRFSPHGWRR